MQSRREKMKAHLKLYLKSFLWFGIPFGTIMGGVDSLIDGLPSGVLSGLISGLIFGVFMSLMLGRIHVRAVRQITPETSEETIGVDHTRSIRLRLPYDDALDLCKECLKSIKGCRITREDRAQGTIEAKAGINWKTWGDVICCKTTNVSENLTQIDVTSRPAMSLTVLDYGRNLENVEKIMSFLRGGARDRVKADRCALAASIFPLITCLSREFLHRATVQAT